MLKRLSILIFIIAIDINLYSNNELSTASFLAGVETFNSSAINQDAFSVFINPASLSHINYSKVLVSFDSFFNLSYFGIAQFVPDICYINLGLFRIKENFISRNGINIGLSKLFNDNFSIGLNTKLYMTNTVIGGVNTNIGFISAFDIGLFYKFSSENPVIKSDLINDRLFLGASLLNILGDEKLTLRLGIGYDIKELNTKLFVDFLPIKDQSISFINFGFSITPVIFNFNYLTLSFSTDLKGFRFDFKINNNRNFELNTTIQSNRILFGYQGLFGKTMYDYAIGYFEDGNKNYLEAKELEKTENLTYSFELYRKAYSDYEKGLKIVKKNEKAEKTMQEINSILMNYENTYLSNAESFYAKKDYVNAYLSYQNAYSVRYNPKIKTKLDEVITNNVIEDYYNKSISNIDVFIKRKEYIKARNLLSTIKLLKPNDKKLIEIEKNLNHLIDEVYYDEYKKAQNNYEKKKYDEALKNINQALVYHPESMEAKNFKDKIIDTINKINEQKQKLEREKLAKEKAEQEKQKALLEEQERQKNIKIAKDLFNSGKYLDAIDYIDAVLQKDKNNQEMLSLRKEVITKAQPLKQKVLTDGINLYDKGDYESAVKEFEKVLKIDPNNIEAKDYLERTKQKIESAKKL